jgi:hypothetical protein
MVQQLIVDRLPMVLWQGPRGGGKSFNASFGTWIDSQQYDDHGTCILGGSRAQSEQIYKALQRFDACHPRRSPLVSFTKQEAHFKTGSTVSVLAASSKSVRGPHVPSLKLDEVDEMDEDLRESAMGMAMGLAGVPATVCMTSTWHKVGGPMTGLMERAKEGAFPVHTFCIFEVLERCPDERSGRGMERCPGCPLLDYCHADRDQHPSGLPKAKRSHGHYPIDSLIQKIKSLSTRVFASDYLCAAPRAAGSWFTAWDTRNVSLAAEMDPALPVHVAVDSGVFTGAVLFQVRPQQGKTGSPHVTVFAEHLAENQPADAVAQAIMGLIAQHCPAQRRTVSTDPAGGSRNPVGPTVINEYLRVGLKGEGGIRHWPSYPGSVTNGLATLEALVRSADGGVHLQIHPRCVRLNQAMQSYVRAKRGGQWQDYPQDPQHPHEDLVDALRGGVAVELPRGREPQRQHKYTQAGRMF